MHDKHLEAFNLMTWNKSGWYCQLIHEKCHQQISKWCKREARWQKISEIRFGLMCSRHPELQLLVFVLQLRWKSHPVFEKPATTTALTLSSLGAPGLAVPVIISFFSVFSCGKLAAATTLIGCGSLRWGGVELLMMEAQIPALLYPSK